jgi:hypothetical protein
VRRFRVRPDSIERKLRHERPQPTDDLIQRVSASIGSRSPRPKWNFAVAFALTVAIFTAFALTGGVSYASSAAQRGVKAVSHVAFTQHSSHSAQSNGQSNGQSSGKSDDNKSGKSHENGNSNGQGGKGNDEHGNGNNGHHGDDQGDDQGNDDGNKPEHDQYREKVLICHHPGAHQHTISVSQNAVPAHLAHGDTLGPCP